MESEPEKAEPNEIERPNGAKVRGGPFSESAADRERARLAGIKSGEARRAKGQAGPVEAVREGPSQQLRDYRWVWEHEEGPDGTAGRRRARKAFESNQGKFEDRLERMEREEAAKAGKRREVGQAAGPDGGTGAATGALEKWLEGYEAGEV
jgi:hypothetical protein